MVPRAAVDGENAGSKEGGIGAGPSGDVSRIGHVATNFPMAQ